MTPIATYRDAWGRLALVFRLGGVLYRRGRAYHVYNVQPVNESILRVDLPMAPVVTLRFFKPTTATFEKWRKRTVEPHCVKFAWRRLPAGVRNA